MLPDKNKGFTLIELLVVIAIIGLLSSVVLASLNTARQKGDVAAVQEEFEQIDTAVENLRLTKGEVMGTITAAGNDDAFCTMCSFPSGFWGGDAEVVKADTPENIAAWTDLGYASVPTDPWGTPYSFDENEFEFNTPEGVENSGPLDMSEIGNDCRYDQIFSAGPDRMFGTADDYYWNIPGLYCPSGLPTIDLVNIGAQDQMIDPDTGISWGPTRLSPQ